MTERTGSSGSGSGRVAWNPQDPPGLFEPFAKRILAALAGLLVAATAWFVTEGLLIVPPKKIAVLIRKTGADLPDGQVLALAPGQKGIQHGVVLEGYHFYNPYGWDWALADQVEIPKGRVGVRTRLFGTVPTDGSGVVDDLPKSPGPEALQKAHRGIVRTILGPGRHAVNPFAERVELHSAVTVPPGHVGVVTLVSAAPATADNTFVVLPGEQGVQREVLQPGTNYVNPYVTYITPVSIQSHRFDMVDKDTISFPSFDGFPISMEGTIEWKVDPERVAEVFVKYVDDRATGAAVGATAKGQAADISKDVIACIVDKVILPNARAYSRLSGSKHLARDFISGDTRRKFQDEFTRGVAESCAEQGILIQSALVRDTVPPPEIARPIQDRELAIRLSEKYEHEKAREKEQKNLVESQRMEQRKTLMKQAQADVSVAVTKAEQEKEVAIIEARRKLEVAQLGFKAAESRAAAVIARGNAEASVILMQNSAEAQGLKDSADAFGGGDGLVRYLLNQKLAPAIQTIVSNTDGPFADLVSTIFQSGATSRKGGQP